MNTLSMSLADSATMLRRNLKHMLRYPSLTLMLIGQPIVFLLLFTFVFGGQLGAGIAPGQGREAYVNYLAPGILLITVASIALATAISVATDMTEGIIDRFRTMAIARVSVLTGHVVGAMIQTAIALVVVIGVSLAVGFRPSAGVLGWLAALGVLAAFAFALTWLTVALGLAAKSVETASNTPLILMLLPFLGSGFVPTASLPGGLRQFAEYQPFTPVTEAVRALLSGTPVGASVLIALAWSAVIAIASYLWSKRLYNHRYDR